MKNILNEIRIVAKKEIKSQLQKKMFWVTQLIWLILMIYVPLNLLLKTADRMSTLSNIWEVLLDIYVSRYVFILVLFSAWMLFTDIFVREKFERTIEALLTTPITIKAIWIGKVFGIFCISYPLAVVAVVFSLIILNLYMASTSLIIPSGVSLLIGFVIGPFFALSFLILIGILYLITSHTKIISLVFFGVNFFYFYWISSTGMNFLTQNTATYSVYYLSGSLIFIIASVILYRFTNREKIISG